MSILQTNRVQLKECNRCGTGNLHWETADDGRYKLYHDNDTLHICESNSNGHVNTKPRTKKTGNKAHNYGKVQSELKVVQLEQDVKILKTELDLMHDELTNLQTKFEEFADAK